MVTAVAEADAVEAGATVRETRDAVLGSARLTVAPARCGAGVDVWALAGLAAGMACVTTP